MTKITTATAAVLLGIGLMTGCTGTETPAEPTKTVTVAPETSPEAAETEDNMLSDSEEDEIYLMVIRDEYPDLAGMPDDDLIDFGRSTCDALDAGVSIEDMFEIAMNSSLDARLAGFSIGAAVGVYCPEYTGDVEEFAGVVSGA